ncbi:inosine triphosphate pyrophosphatase, putative [Eimeria acervulina]|uniref:Inosine triphosphate pyrophosphatase, putative n=1 Tax=Eimeria acervulina TaxID=5801 RepID=U6GFP5_EIMAC|nr:inosine triphosphate pyrophosphatase, putative [Eimeria acervulina]CDI79041.1 inosine triphosphate pyrophosphatase, putative [Eimeria acervulina]
MEGVPVEFRALDVDLPELQGDTAEISRAKCLAAVSKHRSSSSSSSSNGSSSNGSSSELPEFVFTEDTALCFNALGGLPGPYVDCIFEERSSKKTFGEMSTEEKAGVSHRGRAMKQLKEFLLKATA